MKRSVVGHRDIEIQKVRLRVTSFCSESDRPDSALLVNISVLLEM